MTMQTILLIDDDADLLQVLSARCQSLGLSVLHARNLLTASALLEKCVPDLICIDVEMPTGNGLMFCESLMKDSRTRQIPVIVLTGRKDAETIDACARLGLHYACKSADSWKTLKPLVSQLVEEASPRPPATTGIRPRKLPEHLIPLWPEETDAGKSQPQERETPAVARSSSAANTSLRRVLVADDDADLVEMLSERINSLGCLAIGVNTSLDAINAIYRMPPDLVILDVNMPTGSGLSICEMMATEEKLRMLPVIVLTGCSDEKTIRRCHDMLVFYVQKNADVWSRIEPLVRELLHLGDPPTDAASQPPHSSDAKTKSQPAIVVYEEQPETDGSAELVGGPIKEAEASTLMDAVFAMLGAGDKASRANKLRNSQYEESHGGIEIPWVLSIDDDFDFSDVMKLRLDEYGVALARAANGMAGYWMAFSTRARAILLDYQMPNGQGDYILRRLKDNPVTRDIPVVMITGVKDKMLERRVLAMGAAAYLLKPVNFENLREVLGNYIPALRSSATARLVGASH